MKFFNKSIKFLFIFLTVFGLAFSNLPYETLTSALRSYVSSRNVVDKIWMASSDDNVVDKFVPFENVIRNLKIKDALAVSNGDAKIFYSISANTTPRTRDYISSTNTFNTAVSTVVGATALQAVTKASPTKDEMIAGYVNSAGTLQVMCWNGTSWTNEWSVAAGGTGTTRRFDIAYETNSGDVIVAYSRNAAATNAVDYRTKLGSTGCGTANWAAAASIPTTTSLTTGTVHWVKMASDRRTAQNLISIIWADSNADLGASIWSGSAFGQFPTTAQMEQSLEVVTAAQDVEDFDVEYESTSGDVMVVWANSAGANGTNGAFYNVCTGGTSTCTWGTRTAMPTIADDATHLDIAGDPNSDQILYGAIGNAGSDLNRGVWSGSAWTNSAGDITSAAPLAGTKFVAVGWLNNGATKRGVLVYYDSAATNIGWNTVSGTTWTAQTDWAATPVFGVQKNYDIKVDPINKDRLIFAVNDANSDIFTKRLIMDAAGAFTWSNADAGAAIEANTGSATYKSFNFEYNRYIPVAATTLTIGVTAGSKLATKNSGDVDQYAHDTTCTGAASCAAFTLAAAGGTVNVTSIKITESGTATANTELSDANLYYDTDGNWADAGAETLFGTAATFAADQTATISGTLAISAGATAYIYVRYDLANGAVYPIGGATVNFQIAAAADVISDGTESGSGTLAGTQTVLPTADSVTYAVAPDGGRSGNTATISGKGFGAPSLDADQQDCVTATVGTKGCVRFVVGGADTVEGIDISTWNNTTIIFTVSATGLSATNGGAAALEVVAAAQSTATDLTYYVYPTISGFTATFADGGYQDGTITISGDHLGSSGATTNISFNGANPESVGTWTATSIATVATPNTGTDSGTITVTRASDSKASNASSAFYIYPQITGFTAAQTDGDIQTGTITISGNHFGTGGLASNISINGIAPSSIGVWSATSVTTVDIPNTGSDSGVITITNPGTSKTSNNSSTFYIYPQLTSYTATNADGDIQTGTITISGNHFGTGGLASNISINGVAPSSIGVWSATSVTTVDIPNTGTDSGVITVTNPGTSKVSNNSATFYIYPNIISLTVPTATPDAAREYLASDSDGIITANGSHFGAAGSITIIGSASTQQTTATCTVTAYQATCVGLQVPIAIADSTYTGSIVLTRTADSKTSTYAGFRVLPRISSTSPVNLKGGRGDTGVSITGDHLCQSGTCPTAFSAADSVNFTGGSVTSGASTWTNTSIPSITIPSTATDGNLNITSNTSYTSNNLTYDIKFAPTTPTGSSGGGSNNPALSGSVFSDGTDGDVHSDTQWQVAHNTDADWLTPEWTRTAAAAETGTTVNTANGTFANGDAGQTALDCGTTYKGRVRYKDNSGVTSQEWSAYSADFTFSTAACGPDATGMSNSTEAGLTDGSRLGQTVIISGSGFGAVSAGSRANCVGGAGTGCVKIGGTGGQTIADANITAWSDISITINIVSADLTTTYGGATTAGLIVYAAGVSDSNGLTFYIYPDITSLSVVEAREGDVITITGNKFGTGTTGAAVTIVGAASAIPGDLVADVSCDATDGWAETCIKITITTAIADATDSGYVIITQGTGSNSKTSNVTDTQASLGILPRITGISAASFADGGYQDGTFTLNGSHFGATAGSITVNGVAQDGTPTWGVSSITGVGIPNTGTDSGSITLTRSDTKTSNAFSTFFIYPQITGFTAAQTDGDIQTGTITISGNHFGTGGLASNISINGIAPSSIGVWSATSVTTVDIPNTGSDSGVITITNPGTSKTSNNSTAFYIYPNIISFTVPTVNPDAGREYLASDSDGIITANGSHFGAAGSVTIIGFAATQQTTGTCVGTAYQATCVGLQVPTTIADNSYTGNAVLTRTSDSKTATYSGFRILPRVTAFSPVSPAVGDAVQIQGDHFCQSGTCPTGTVGEDADLVNAPGFSASNRITFTSSVVASYWGANWNHGVSPNTADTKVPTGAVSGGVILKSNTYDSNSLSITLASNVPNDPTSLGQFRNAAYTDSISIGGAASSTTIYFQMTMQASVSGGTLYPQIEAKAIGVAFSCTTGVCASASEGTGQAGPGPATGQVSAVLTTNTQYHWQGRVRHNKGGSDYYSNWVSFGGNTDPNDVDFYIDTTGPIISSSCGLHSAVTATGATITWSLTDNFSTTFTKQVQYDTSSAFTSSTCTPGATCGEPTSGYSSGSQIVTLTNLNPNTVYYYRARSKDAAANETIIGYGLNGDTACTFTTSKAETRTTEFYIATRTTVLTGGSTYSPTFTVYIPEAGYNIQSAFVELSGIFGIDTDTSGQISAYVNSQTQVNYAVNTSTSVNTPFSIIHQVPTANLNIATPTNPTNTNTLNVIVATGDPSVSIVAAKIVVTYYHTPVQ